MLDASIAEETFEVGEPLVLISIGESFKQVEAGEIKLYDAVRWAWKVSLRRVRERKLVLAHHRGIVVGAYRPDEWLEATPENFPGWSPVPGRYGFHGTEAEQEAQDKYVGKRVPEHYRRQGAAYPIRYCPPKGQTL